MSMEEVEELNPHFKWPWRKQKRRVKSLAKKLIPNVTYAMGCRGHPGLVVKKDYHPDDHRTWVLMGADVEIKSLVDGVEESCSVYHCVPHIITKEEAERRAEFTKTHHSLDVSVEFGGYTPEEMREYWDNWIKEGMTWYVLWDQDGQVVRSSSVMTIESARAEIERMDQVFPGCNPRKVDMRTYPAAPKLLGL